MAMKGLDALFGDDIGQEIEEISIDQLELFPDHPFHVTEDDAMTELIESIREEGIITPLIVLQKEEGYIIISGHRRSYAARKAGLAAVPCIVVDIEHDTAVKWMVDANLQRPVILPSEKAFAYKMKMDVTKHQGRGSVDAGSADEIGQATGDSGRTVQRYIRLTYLLPELLQKVDEEELSLVNGVYLSYLTSDNQSRVLRWYQEKNLFPKTGVCKTLKERGSEEDLTEEEFLEIVEEITNTLGSKEDIDTALDSEDTLGSWNTGDTECEEDPFDRKEDEEFSAVSRTSKTSSVKENYFADDDGFDEESKENFSEADENIRQTIGNGRTEEEAVQAAVEEEMEERRRAGAVNQNHYLKVSDMYWEDILSGTKPFELQKNDRNYKVGDTLILKKCTDGHETGEALEVEVTFLLQDYTGLQDGYCILGIRVISQGQMEGADYVDDSF